MAHPGGRPTKFTQELADKLCSQLAEGKSIRTVCYPQEMPSIETFFRWLRTKPDFREQYARAKEEAADALTDEILDIADDARNDYMTTYNPRTKQEEEILNREHVERSKLRIESRKWLASKLKPKRYGDKLDMTTNGKDLPTPILGGASLNNTTDDKEEAE